MKKLFEKIKIDFSKEKKKQYLTIGLILVFIFSTLSIIGGTLGVNEKVQYIDGVAEAKAKIYSYGLELTVFEPNEKTLEIIEVLKKEKKLSQVINFDKEIILSLKNKEDVYQIATKIQETGAKVVTEADIYIYDINFRLPNGEKIKINEQKRREKISPIFEIDEVFEVQFSAVYINSSNQKDKELLIANLILKQPKTEQKVLEVIPLEMEKISKKITLIFPWSERKNLEEFISSYPIKLNYTKKIINYIYFKNRIEKDTLKQLAEQKPPYIITIRENGIEIKNDFLDEEQIRQFFKERNIEIEIPQQKLEFENVEQKDLEELIKKYEQIYGSKVNIEIKNKIRVNKMDILDENNIRYDLKRTTEFVVETDLEPENIKKILINSQIYEETNKIIEYSIEKIE